MNMTTSKRHLITRELAAVAMGTLPADLILKNGSLVDVCTARVRPDCDLAVYKGIIACVGSCEHIMHEPDRSCGARRTPAVQQGPCGNERRQSPAAGGSVRVLIPIDGTRHRKVTKQVSFWQPAAPRIRSRQSRPGGRRSVWPRATEQACRIRHYRR